MRALKENDFCKLCETDFDFVVEDKTIGHHPFSHTGETETALCIRIDFVTVDGKPMPQKYYLPKPDILLQQAEDVFRRITKMREKQEKKLAAMFGPG